MRCRFLTCGRARGPGRVCAGWSATAPRGGGSHTKRTMPPGGVSDRHIRPLHPEVSQGFTSGPVEAQRVGTGVGELDYRHSRPAGSRPSVRCSTLMSIGEMFLR
jgi:hypothetical protein